MRLLGHDSKRVSAYKGLAETLHERKHFDRSAAKDDNVLGTFWPQVARTSFYFVSDRLA